MSWYGRGRAGGPLGPSQNKPLALHRVSDTLSPQALLRWRAYLLHTCLPLRVSARAWLPPPPLPSRSSLEEGCISRVVCLVLVGSALRTAKGSQQQAGLESRQVWLSRLHKGLGSLKGGAQALVPTDSGPSQVDCTFSYLEVQAMVLQETPPQVRCLVPPPRPTA